MIHGAIYLGHISDAVCGKRVCCLLFMVRQSSTHTRAHTHIAHFMRSLSSFDQHVASHLFTYFSSFSGFLAPPLLCSLFSAMM